MATIQTTGVEAVTATAYAQRLRDVFTQALGDDADLHVSTPNGQIIGLLAQSLAEVDQSMVSLYNAVCLETAIGSQLDNLVSLLGIRRRAATRSTVEVVFTAPSGTNIPAGTRLTTTDGDLFTIDAGGVVQAGGTITLAATASDIGHVPIAANSLTLTSTIAGVTATTNAAGAEGAAPESDRELRSRYARTLLRYSAGTRESLESRICDVAGVTACRVLDNSSASPVTIQTITIPARSILCVVDGGTDNAVATAIADAKPLGVPTDGTTDVTVYGASVKFTKVTRTPIHITVDISITTSFPGNGVGLIKDRLAGYMAGTWRSGPGDFDVSGQSIGEGVAVNRLYSPINSVPGHSTTTLTVTDASDNALPAVTPLTTLYTLSADDVTVNVA